MGFAYRFQGLLGAIELGRRAAHTAVRMARTRTSSERRGIDAWGSSWERVAGHSMCAACNVHAELTSCGSFASLSPPVSEHLPGLPHETGRLIT